MSRNVLISLFVVVFMTLSFAAWAQEDPEKQSVTEDDLENMLKADRPAKKEKAEEPKGEEKKAEDQAAAPVEEKAQKITYPVDERKIKVAITMKNGKTIKGVVRHFLVSEKVIDHMAEMNYSLSDGPTVRYKMDEFSLPWDKIRSIEFAKRNKENGEISCVEVSDISPDRFECIMQNEYNATSKDKTKKGAHIILNKEVFRFVIDTGKGIVNVDSHLGKVKITNERDESRNAKAMEKELRDVFKTSILKIAFN